MPPDTPDLFVPIELWNELLRLSAVMGYPPERHLEAAAVEALTRAGALTADYDFDHIELTPAGATIRRLRPEGR